MIFLIRSKVQGSHTHVSMFVSNPRITFAKCGEIVMRNDEWEAFLTLLKENSPCAELQVNPKG